MPTTATAAGPGGAHHAVADVAFLHFVDQGGDSQSQGGAQGMAQGNTGAVDIDPVIMALREFPGILIL